MRTKKDDFIRDYNPILFDVISNETDDQVWALYNRINREIGEAHDVINLKQRSATILRQELECRGQIPVDHR